MLLPQFPIIIFDKTFDGGVLVLIYRTVVPCAGDPGLMGTGHCLETFLIFMARGSPGIGGRGARDAANTPQCTEQPSNQMLP